MSDLLGPILSMFSSIRLTPITQVIQRDKRNNQTNTNAQTDANTQNLTDSTNLIRSQQSSLINHSSIESKSNDRVQTALEEDSQVSRVAFNVTNRGCLCSQNLDTVESIQKKVADGINHNHKPQVKKDQGISLIDAKQNPAQVLILLDTVAKSIRQRLIDAKGDQTELHKIAEELRKFIADEAVLQATQLSISSVSRFGDLEKKIFCEPAGGYGDVSGDTPHAKWANATLTWISQNTSHPTQSTQQTNGGIGKHPPEVPEININIQDGRSEVSSSRSDSRSFLDLNKDAPNQLNSYYSPNIFLQNKENETGSDNLTLDSTNVDDRVKELGEEKKESE